MDWVAYMILSIEGFVFFGLLVLVIILAVRRFRIKKEETFEDRDN
jgi:hypothetical protein|tara:strand:- start:10770 stop:10904 length:135 start_codon:yes stop_codon:yes gene_type:complete